MSYLLDVLVEETAIDVNPEGEMFVDLVVTSEGPSVELIVTDTSVDIVTSETTIDLVVESVQVLDILEVGAPGLPGPPGTPSGSFYYEQINPATVWSIPHNLGYEPAGIEVEDQDGNRRNPRVFHASVNNLMLFFNEPVAGPARLS